MLDQSFGRDCRPRQLYHPKQIAKCNLVKWVLATVFYRLSCAAFVIAEGGETRENLPSLLISQHCLVRCLTAVVTTRVNFSIYKSATFHCLAQLTRDVVQGTAYLKEQTIMDCPGGIRWEELYNKVNRQSRGNADVVSWSLSLMVNTR